MAKDDLHGRLAAIPGVLTCTLTEETVALLVHPEVDSRLLKARAQVACAELGDRRPLIIVGGLPAPSARGAVGGSGTRSRRATPLAIAAASLFVLSAVVIIPVNEDRRAPARGETSPAATVAVAATPLAPVPAQGDPASEAKSREPSAFTPVSPLPPSEAPVVTSGSGLLVALPPSSVDTGSPDSPAVLAPTVKTSASAPSAAEPPPPVSPSPGSVTSEPATPRASTPVLLASGTSASTTPSETEKRGQSSRADHVDDPAPAQSAAANPTPSGAAHPKVEKAERMDKAEKADKTDGTDGTDKAKGRGGDSATPGRGRAN